MINERDPFEAFDFGGAEKLATIEACKRHDEMVENAIWSLDSEPESDTRVGEVSSVFKAGC